MKKNLLLLFGGKSLEHSISIISAKNIYSVLNFSKYNIFLVGIAKNGKWYFINNEVFENLSLDPNEVEVPKLEKNLVFLVPDSDGNKLFFLNQNKKIAIDVVFPILHGTNGEDGAIQGLLQTLDIPYVGNNVLSSAICMDKDITKRLLQLNDIPVIPYKFFYRKNFIPKFKILQKELDSTNLFIKCAHQGSSYGVYKAHSEDEFIEYIEKAFEIDDKILVEKALDSPREIEISFVNDKNEAIVSLPGEIRPRHEFYDFEAKYTDENGAELIYPADLDTYKVVAVQTITRKVIETLELKSYSRIDMFIDNNGKIYVNEVNTIPGFTKISMFPKLMGISGYSYKDLVELLITESLRL